MLTEHGEQLISKLAEKNAELTGEAAILRAEEARLRRLTQRLYSVREEEHTRLARQIHDLLGQSLTMLKIGLSELSSELAAGDPTLHAQARQLLGEVDCVVQATRQIAAHLRTPILDDLGLSAALEWAGQRFTDRTGIPCTMELHAEDVQIEAARALYAIAQEALTNVIRHADARSVTLRLTGTRTQIVLEVNDDGNGFEASRLDHPHTLGLFAMQERAAAVGAVFSVRSERGRGTTVSVHVPLSGAGTVRA